MRRKTTLLIFASASILVAGLALSRATAEEAREIRVVAKKFEFVPARIELKQGETVTLVLESEDTKHGLKCKELNIDSGTFKKGEPARVTVTASKVGTFEFKCSHFCGVGHKKMTGEIVVTAP